MRTLQARGCEREKSIVRLVKEDLFGGQRRGKSHHGTKEGRRGLGDGGRESQRKEGDGLGEWNLS